VAQGHRVVVVVSAMGNTTNELLGLARSMSPHPGRRELDLLVSVGERVSMTLLAMAIQDLGVDAASFTGSQSGIITDDQHVAAQVLEVRPHRVRAALDAGKVAIVAGFQGVSRHGEVTTLGRGGSDTTAVVMTAALGADHCEICSDVDGVHSADPRNVPDAQRLDVLPLDAAAALSQAGAKVLLADAVERARSMGVELQAAATAKPPGSGTRLPPGPTPDAVVAVTVDTELRHFVGEGIPLGLTGARAWWTEGGTNHLVWDTRNDHGGDPPWPDAGEGLPVAMVSAVGRSVVREGTVLQRAIGALNGIEIQHWWAHGDMFCALIDPVHAKQAERELHATLLAKPPDQA
jgi:aspartokinase